MVATKYTQSVKVKISTGGKIMLYAGVILQIASLALLIVGIFVNQYVLFAFIGVLGIGVLLLSFITRKRLSTIITMQTTD